MQKTLLLALISVGIFFATSRASDPSSDALAESKKLLHAIEAGDFQGFIADGTDAFKALHKAQFDSAAAQLAPKMKAGYETLYLGELNQQGCKVSLWKLKFSSGGDDRLAVLSLKDGKVAGFVFQ